MSTLKHFLDIVKNKNILYLQEVILQLAWPWQEESHQ